jgi:mRNA interferase YafO
MPAIKISTLFEQINNWKNFAAHFYNYKICDELPAIFGRDERLDLNDMHHIHLASSQALQARWEKSIVSITAQHGLMMLTVTFG